MFQDKAFFYQCEANYKVLQRIVIQMWRHLCNRSILLLSTFNLNITAVRRLFLVDTLKELRFPESKNVELAFIFYNGMTLREAICLIKQLEAI